jgi:hypothetical protein
MTTWDEPCYTTDTISQLANKCPKDEKLVAQILDAFKFKIPNPIECGFDEKIDLTRLRDFEVMFPGAFERKDEYQTKAILDFMKPTDIWYHGIAAVYKVWYQYTIGLIEFNPELNMKIINRINEEACKLDFYASYMTPKRIAETIRQTNMDTKTYSMYRHYIESAYSVTHAAYFWRARSMQDKVRKAQKNGQKYPSLTKDDLSFGKKTKITSFPGLLVLTVEQKDTETPVNYILSMKSVRRLSSLLRSSAKIVSYFDIQSKRIKNKAYLTDATKIIEYIAECAYKTDRPNELARALDVYYYLACSYYTSDVVTWSHDLQSAKISTNEYEKIIDSRYLLSLTRKWKMYECLDLMKIYKILPTPDFDPFTGFLNMKKYHLNRNTYGILTQEQQKLGLTISEDEFRMYRQWMYLQRFYRRHGRCPGRLTTNAQDLIAKNQLAKLSTFPYTAHEAIGIQDMIHIELEGSGVWEDVDNNIPEYYQDKACPPQRIDLNKIENQRMYMSLPLNARSYLAWYLNEPEVLPGYGIRLAYKYKHYLRQQTAHFKPESKKPEPRNFYSAPPLMRRMIGEYEQNVRQYMAHDVGAILGKDPHDLSKAMHHILGTEYERETHRWIVVSFDLEKFSPSMPERTKVMSNELWISVFKQSNLDMVVNTYDNLELHFLHEGIHQKYTTPTVDLEGQGGTVNTALHVDIMGYAVRQLKRLGYIKSPARLGVMIDDGLLALPFELGTSNELVVKAVKVIEAVYNFFGLRISWDKTFVSEHFSMFLNEVYYDGLNVTTGVKAFLKMQATKLEDELSVIGKIKGLTGMAQGCISTGLPPHLAKAELHREVLMLLQRTMKRSPNLSSIPPLHVAYFMFTPISFGGIGLPILSQIEGSPNVEPVKAFISMAYYVAGTLPNTARMFDKILSQTLRTRRDIDILRAPDAFRIDNRTFTEMKHITYVLTMVKTLAQNSLIRPLLHIDMDIIAGNILESLGNDCHLAEINIAYRLSPIAAVDKFMSKFKRSSTMIALLSQRMKAKLIGRYITEANTVFRNFTSLIVDQS